MHRRPAARAIFVFGLDRHMNPRQMGRKRAATGAAFVGANANRRFILLVFCGFAGRDGLFDILKRQGELVRIEFLGTAAKLHALQLMQKMPQAIILRQSLIALCNRGVTLGERRRKLRLQRGYIGWKLVRPVAHAQERIRFARD